MLHGNRGARSNEFTQCEGSITITQDGINIAHTVSSNVNITQNVIYIIENVINITQNVINIAHSTFYMNISQNDIDITQCY